MAEPLDNIGGYRIVETLGRGGMGVVYRGRHVQSGQMVALKTVPLPSTNLLQSLRREIRSLARVRHPGIVRIVDSGIEAGLPWYAMELLEGLSLQQVSARLWSGQTPPGTIQAFGETVHRPPLSRASAATPPLRWTPLAQVEADTDRPEGPDTASFDGPAVEPQPAEDGPARAALLPAACGKLPQVLGLIQRLCGALAFLHGEGIVHRDLKPANILIRADLLPGERDLERWLAGQPVLVDFGGSTRFWGGVSRESLDGVGSVVGTAGYMAPEQIQGELVDARADLYALGCILYELVTGRRPFLGKSDQAVLRKHLEEAPLRPSALVTGLPPELEDLILRLLAKRPRDRVGYADDVAAALLRLGCDRQQLDGHEPKARPFLHRADLAGRGAVLQQFEEALQGLGLGSGGMLLLSGESGLGKTRVVMEVSRMAQRTGMHVLAGECLPLSGSAAPLHPLRRALQAIADRCRELGPAEMARLVGRRARVLAEYEPALAGLFGQTVPDAVEAQNPAPLPADAARLRLFQDLFETFCALAQDRPLVLILDDLQWADELTLGFLEYLMRVRKLGAQKAAPILVVGTYRAEDAGAAGASALQALLERPEVTLIPLERLGERAVARMAGDMLAMADAPERFTRFLSEQSEGNAFFVAEYLRAAVAEGILHRDSAGRWQMADAMEAQNLAPLSDRVVRCENLPLPRTLRELVGRRLAGLNEEARCVLEAVAVLGREPELTIVVEMTRFPDDAWLDALSELLRRQIVELGPAGRLRFLHDRFREVAYERLDERRRQELHHAAAEAIEAVRGSATQQEQAEDFAALAHHWEEAGAAGRSRSYALAGARQAEARYAHGEAERLYRAYLRLAEGPSAEGVAARNELGSQVLALAGRGAEAVEEHRSALEEAVELGDVAAQCASARLLGEAHRSLGQHEEARARLEQALALARASGDRRQECRILPGLAGVHWTLGRSDTALELIDRAVTIARETGDEAAEATCLGNLAIVRSQQGRLEEARELMVRALELHRRAGNRVGEGRNLYNLAVLHVFQGQLEEARSIYEQAIAVHRESGDRFAEAVDLENMANLYQKMGLLDLAGRGFEQAIEALQRAGNRQVEGCARSNFGDLRLQQARVEEAGELYRGALELHREVGDLRAEAVTCLSLAILERRMGRLEAALQLAQEAEPLVLRGGDQLHLVLCRCDQGHIELAFGRPARRLLDEAAALATALHLGPQSEAGLSLARLGRAVAAFEAGHPELFRGELPEDLPEPLLRRLMGAGEAGAG